MRPLRSFFSLTLLITSGCGGDGDPPAADGTPPGTADAAPGGGPDADPGVAPEAIDAFVQAFGTEDTTARQALLETALADLVEVVEPGSTYTTRGEVSVWMTGLQAGDDVSSGRGAVDGHHDHARFQLTVTRPVESYDARVHVTLGADGRITRAEMFEGGVPPVGTGDASCWFYLAQAWNSEDPAARGIALQFATTEDAVGLHPTGVYTGLDGLEDLFGLGYAEHPGRTVEATSGIQTIGGDAWVIEWEAQTAAGVSIETGFLFARTAAPNDECREIVVFVDPVL